jgi:hypothetical protein
LVWHSPGGSADDEQLIRALEGDWVHNEQHVSCLLPCSAVGDSTLGQHWRSNESTLGSRTVVFQLMTPSICSNAMRQRIVDLAHILAAQALGVYQCDI